MGGCVDGIIRILAISAAAVEYGTSEVRSIYVGNDIRGAYTAKAIAMEVTIESIVVAFPRLSLSMMSVLG
jgi:hypothetical protein